MKINLNSIYFIGPGRENTQILQTYIGDVTIFCPFMDLHNFTSKIPQQTRKNHKMNKSRDIQNRQKNQTYKARMEQQPLLQLCNCI